MSQLVLVLDQGGHSSRAMVFDECGKIVAQASEPVYTNINSIGWIEQNPVELVDSLFHVLALIADQLHGRCRDIVAAALIVQRSSIVAWDTSTNEHLSPVLSWQDTRNSDWLDRKLEGKRDFIREKTGLYANAHFGASKMRWLLDNLTAVKSAADNNHLCIAPLASFLQQQLAGKNESTEPVVDAVIASRTMLTELGASCWSTELLEFFSIPEKILPRIKPTLSDYGRISVGDFSVPLQLLGGDQSFFSLAHKNAIHGDTVFINAGTGAFVQQNMPVASVPREMLCAPLVISEVSGTSIIVAEGTVNAAATALDWFWQRAGCDFAAADWLQAAHQAEQNPESVPVFFNRITASGSPDWLASAESFFTEEASVPLCAIAVLESIVFALQRNLDCLALAQTGESDVCNGIVLSGGLSRLEIFCRRLADLSGVPVLCSDDAEACARGAAMQLLPSAVGQSIYEQYLPTGNSALEHRYLRWSAQMDKWSTLV